MKIYCSGIGGIGLSAYASLQRAAGHEVSGSDRSDSALLEDLRSQGILVTLEQDGSHVPADADLFVHSEAIAQDAPERVRATELGLRQISYFQALGEISKDSYVIAVCGTHGKSSTTAMAAKVLIEAGKDPTVVVGTKVPGLQGDLRYFSQRKIPQVSSPPRNWRYGKSDLFLLEACEYRRSFHHLSPDLILMTNVDGDHFDAYRDLAEYQQAFVDFLRLLPEGCGVITHGKDPGCARVVRASGKPCINADHYELPALATPGFHMQQNAQLVLGLAEVLNIPEADAMTSLAGYGGTWRRMEKKGMYGGVPVIDDYGHHPVEIAATLRALKEAYPARRLVCVFQPHTHDRTLKLYDDFTRAFTDADLLLLPDVYDARHEIESATVDMQALVKDIAAGSSVETRAAGSLTETEALLRSGMLRAGDLLVCMGAGDITKLASVMVSPVEP